MSEQKIAYKIKTASAEDIFNHLLSCNDHFVPPLTHRLNIDEYSRKLFTKSVTFEAWIGNDLAGLIAVYLNDDVSLKAFVSSVSVLNKYAGRRIAATLMENVIEYARKNTFRELWLEVMKSNEPAIKLYRKFKFSVHWEKKDIYCMQLKIV